MRGRCVCGCGRKRGCQFHHCVYRQELRRLARELTRGDVGPPLNVREATLLNDRRNLVPLGPRCHAAHHNRSRVLPLKALPDSVFEFAAQYMGEGRAYEYLHRYYAGDDPRLDALLACHDDRNGAERPVNASYGDAAA